MAKKKETRSTWKGNSFSTFGKRSFSKVEEEKEKHENKSQVRDFYGMSREERLKAYDPEMNKLKPYINYARKGQKARENEFIQLL